VQAGGLFKFKALDGFLFLPMNVNDASSSELSSSISSS